MMRRALFAGLLSWTLSCFASQAFAGGMVQYNRDIRPILSENCFACHGPDVNKRAADLRLDVRDVALEKGAIVPGQPDASSLLQRIFSTDPSDVMPPPES
ncbi:MAG: c-type cytochrome domain-containing protein, partial [Planctomycetota bacterium]